MGLVAVRAQRKSPERRRAAAVVRRVVLLTVALAALLVLGASVAHGQGDAPVHVLTLDGTVNPALADYLKRGIEGAEREGAAAVLLELDTPGGLDDSTRKMIQAIDNSTVPVIVYVAPQGARAASAGAFIGLAAHVLAMSPGTTIGSATPISIGAGGEAQDLPQDLRNKVVNEAVSYIRAHADHHGRNADWAEKAVREGANLPASEAVEQNVADLLARTRSDLLQAIDGREVEMATGELVTLATASAPVRMVNMSPVERFLHVISNPNIAFLLLSLAMLGLFIELSNPGLVFPGVAGGIALLLALYSLGTLEAYWGGMLLVVLAFGLLVAEVLTPTYGILGGGGIIAMIVGGLLLFSQSPPALQVSPWLLGGVAIVAAAFFLVVVRAVVKSHRHDLAPMGYRSLAGARGVARTALDPEGSILVQGERWRAVAAEGDIQPGDEVVVERADGMLLHVARKPEGG